MRFLVPGLTLKLIEIFFPSLLTLILGGSFTWIAWVVFDSDKLKEWGKAKFYNEVLDVSYNT
jgi:hypothetical protein